MRSQPKRAVTGVEPASYATVENLAPESLKFPGLRLKLRLKLHGVNPVHETG